MAALAAMARGSDAADSHPPALQSPHQPPPPPPLVRVRLRTFPAMMLASAAILTCEAFAINYISSPSPFEELLRESQYTVEYHDPLVRHTHTSSILTQFSI